MNLKLDDILLLLVHLYSFAGDQREKDLPLELENRLKSLIAELLVDDCHDLSERMENFGMTCLHDIHITKILISSVIELAIKSEYQ